MLTQSQKTFHDKFIAQNTWDCRRYRLSRTLSASTLKRRGAMAAQLSPSFSIIKCCPLLLCFMWYLMLTTADGVGVISSIAQLLPPLGNFLDMQVRDRWA
jgi:hypothetical protein